MQEARFDVPVLILKLSKQYEPTLTYAQLYERTRGLWRIDPSKHPSVRYAMPVSPDGVICEVFRIQRWIEVDMSTIRESALRRQGLHVKSKSRFRWMFEGDIDLEMRKRYVGKTVPNIRVQAATLWRGPAEADVVGPSISRFEPSHRHHRP